MTMIKKLFQLSRNEWPLLLLGLLFLGISSTALLIYPYTIKRIIDEALATKNTEQLNLAALLALGIFIIQSITSALRYYYFTVAGEKTVKRLRRNLFSQIIAQDIPFFDEHKTGELLGRLSSDTAVLQNALSVNISMLIRSLVQCLGGLVMLFITSAKLTIFIFIIIPPMGFIAARFGKRVKAISKKSQDALAQSTQVAEQVLSSSRTVKAFCKEEDETTRYKEKLERSFLLSREKILEIAKFTNLLSSTGFIAVVFIIWFGASLVISGELSIGTLTSYLLYVMTVAFSVGMLGSLWTDFMSAIGASGRILELLEKRGEDLTAGEELKNLNTLELKNVHFSYPARADFEVLSGINFTLSKHETLAIVGTSGSGKSTLTQLLLGFYQMNQGSILIDGKNLSSYSLKSLRCHIGHVSQEPILVSDTIYENICYGKQGATLEEVEAAAQMAFAHDFILSFPQGYQTLVGERGIQLSGGQKQRIAIARALIKNPSLLIMDEATSSLDSESEHYVQMALDAQLGKRATIIIAHRLSTVRRADKIVVLSEGKVVQSGSHQELLNQPNGLYYKLVERQFKE
jgi:ATP-binding cassette subfamily B protein